MSNRQHLPSARALCAHGRLLLQLFAAGHMAPRRGLASFNARHNILQVATALATPLKSAASTDQASHGVTFFARILQHALGGHIASDGQNTMVGTHTA